MPDPGGLELDLPEGKVGSSFGEIDLPALPDQPAPPEPDLPSLRSLGRAEAAGRAEPPAQPPSQLGEVELPSLSDSISTLDDNLPLPSGHPSPARDLPAVSGDLPMPGGNLPMPGGNLPMPGGNLPMPGGNLPVPGGNLPAQAGALPAQAAGPPGAPGAFQPRADSFGELELPLVGGSGASPPAFASDAPNTEDADPFGASLPPPPSVPPPGPAEAPLQRQAGGGTSYGEVNLEGGGGELGEVRLESAPPVPERDAEDDMEFGAIPQEREPVAQLGQEQEIERPAFRMPVGVRAAPSVESPRPEGRGWRIAAAVVVLLALAGATLTLVPSVGPFGAYWIVDHLKAGQYRRLVRQTVAQSNQQLAADVSPNAERALAIVDRARSQNKRLHALAQREVFVTFMVDLRFGAPPQAVARANVLLQDLTDNGAADDLDLERAAQAADSGNLARARATLQKLWRTKPHDIDVAVLRGEVELKAHEPKAALAAWKDAALLKRSARTAFGLCRAEYALGDWTVARKQAELTLKDNPKHVGAKIILARVAWKKNRDDQAALTLLQKVLTERQMASSDELVAAQTLRGDIELAHFHVSQAKAAFDDALKLDPKAAGALSGLGDALYYAGRYSEALARFEAATQADPEDVASQVGVAKAKLALEHPQQARDLLKKLSQSHPKSMDVAYWYGEVEASLGERKQAEKSYRTAIANSGKDAGVIDSYIALALLLNQEGRAEDAQQLLAEARNKLPDSPALHRGLGELALRQGRYDGAITEFKLALKLDRSDVRSKFRLAVALTKHRDFDQAQKMFDQVEKIDHDYPGLALARGQLYEAMGQPDRALKAYEGALAKAPNDLDLMLRVGCGKVAAGRAKEAETLLRKVLQQRPQSAETNACLGRALLIEGTSPLEALSTFQRAVELDPHRAEYYMYVGWAANEAGQVNTAQRALTKALELDQGLGDAYWQRGILRYRQGAVKDAVRDLQKALTLSPGRYEVHAALADAYNDLGKQADAMTEWQKAVTADPSKAVWHFRYGKLLSANRRNADARRELGKAISLGEAETPSPGWLWEAHLLLARAMGREKGAVQHWEAFLRLGPSDSPYRSEAKKALARLGHPWQGE